MFLSTFTDALTVLRSVRTAGDGQVQFVPRLSVTVGFVLAVASVVGLVLFLAHLAQQIRVETMLRNVHDNASATVARVLGGDRTPGVPVEPPQLLEGALHVLAPGSGFLVGVNVAALLDAAVAGDAVILIDPQPGDPLVSGTPLGWIWPRSGEPLTQDRVEELRRSVRRAVSVGFERTATQDIGFGLRQLTDVANKALSPGINDPTTAVHALGHSAALLCEIVAHDLGPTVMRDRDSAVRVVLHRPDPNDLLEPAIEQPRRYGASDPAVLTQLYLLLRQLAWCAPASGRGAIRGQLDRLDAAAAAQDFDNAEHERLAELIGSVEQALRGVWRPRAM